jgi:alpha-galactosidase
MAKETQELWNKHPEGAHGIPKAEERPRVLAEQAAATGVYYREMIKHVRRVLKDIKRVVPEYDKDQGYELAGFIWFQGFNDYVDGGVYPNQNNPGGYDLYADLLGHLIRDVRKDLSAPKLPFVIGVMGIDGLEGDTKAPMMHFRAAQRTPATLEEFKGNVLAIETAPFWDDDLSALHDRMERLTDTLDAQFNRTPEMAEEERDQARQKAIAEKFTPEELRRFRSGVSNGGYHYLGAAKIMAPIGKAYADALVASHSGQK